MSTNEATGGAGEPGAGEPGALSIISSSYVGVKEVFGLTSTEEAYYYMKERMAGGENVQAEGWMFDGTTYTRGMTDKRDIMLSMLRKFAPPKLDKEGQRFTHTDFLKAAAHGFGCCWTTVRNRFDELEKEKKVALDEQEAVLKEQQNQVPPKLDDEAALLRALRKKVSDLESAQDALKEELQNTLTNNTYLQTQLETADAENERLTNETNTLQAELRASTNTIQQKQWELQGFRAGSNAELLKHELEELRSKIKDRKAELDQVMHAIEAQSDLTQARADSQNNQLYALQIAIGQELPIKVLAGIISQFFDSLDWKNKLKWLHTLACWMKTQHEGDGLGQQDLGENENALKVDVQIGK